MSWSAGVRFPESSAAGITFPLQGGLANLSATGSTHSPSSPASWIKVSAYTAPERWTCRSAPLGNFSRNARSESGPWLSYDRKARAVRISLSDILWLGAWEQAVAARARQAMRRPRGCMIAFQCSAGPKHQGVCGEENRRRSGLFGPRIGPVWLRRMGVGILSQLLQSTVRGVNRLIRRRPESTRRDATEVCTEA